MRSRVLLLRLGSGGLSALSLRLTIRLPRRLARLYFHNGQSVKFQNGLILVYVRYAERVTKFLTLTRGFFHILKSDSIQMGRISDVVRCL